jgi:hypothetical protein
MANRNSRIILAKNVKMDKDMRNVVNYTTNQMIDMLTDSDHYVISDGHYSFIRNTGTIQTEFEYDVVLQANYIAFENYDYSNKWFFAWIEDVIYKGEKNTEIKYKVDSFSTFNQDLNYENCFVVREHVNDDTIGLHTVPENLETGDPIQEGTTGFITELGVTHVTVLEVDAYPVPDSYVQPNNPQVVKFRGVTQYNNLVSGHQYIVCDTLQDTSRFVDRMNKDGVVESIKNMYLMPSSMFTLTEQTRTFSYDANSSDQSRIFYYYIIDSSTQVKTFSANIDKSYTFTGYIPKNNKCKVYPYNYLMISNNVGQTKILKYEDFSTSNCTMSVVGCVCIGGSFKLIPENYRGIQQNFDESISLGKYPTCAWTSDAYTNWISQQGVNQFAESGTNIVKSALSGAVLGGGAGATGMAGLTLAGEVVDWIGSEKDAKLTPNTSGGANTGNVNWAIGGNNFFLRRLHCKPEYMRIIDEYFTRFGYKVNRLKTPNVTGRAFFNFVQVATSDDPCYASIPEMYLDEIIKAFRRGITIWHDASKIGDYTVNNAIV